MTAEVVDGLLVAAIYIGGFFALVLLATVISEVVRRIFPNFDRKMFALFGLNIDDYDDDEEDDEPNDGKIILFRTGERK